MWSNHFKVLGVWFTVGFFKLSGFDFHSEVGSIRQIFSRSRNGISPSLPFPIAYALVSHSAWPLSVVTYSSSSSCKGSPGLDLSSQNSTDFWWRDTEQMTLLERSDGLQDPDLPIIGHFAFCRLHS